MLESCLRHKIIRDFLKHYTEKRWKDIIPSLIQIGILNLQKSFNKIIFTIDELKMVLHHLQISQIEAKGGHIGVDGYLADDFFFSFAFLANSKSDSGR